MLSHRIRQGEHLGLNTAPRDLDLYPRDVHVDFRRLEQGPLKRLASYFGAGDTRGLPRTEVARRVARSFNDMEVEEHDTLSFFVEYIVALGGSTGMVEEAKRSQLNGRRLRKRTRRPGEDSSDDDRSPIDPAPTRGGGRNSAAASSASRANGGGGGGSPDPHPYCLCKRPSFGEMIACDDEDCEIEWFHISCVGIKEGEIRDEWFCPNCLARREAAAAATAAAEAEAAAAAAAASSSSVPTKQQEEGRPTRRTRSSSIDKDDGSGMTGGGNMSTGLPSKSTWKPGGKGGGGQRRGASILTTKTDE